MARTAIHEDVEELRQRLAEAEDALRAIRSGEVDAVVVSGPKGDQVYVVKGAEQAYRSFVENMNEGAITLLSDGTISYSNQRFADMLKTPLEQVIGASLESFVAPDSRRQVRFLLGRARDTKTEGEVAFLCSDRTTLWVELSLSPVAQAESGGICVVANDITERKKANEMRSYLAAIVDSSDEAIIGKDLNGKIISWNSGAARLYGYSAGEVIGRPLSILLPPERLGELTITLERIKRGERVEQYDTERLRKTGERVPVAITISPIRDSEGHVTGASSIARDITERRQAEAELRRAGVYNRSLIEASLDPLVTIAPSGAITDVNRATEQITGRSRDALIGTDFSCYFTDAEKARRGYEQAFREGFVHDYELEIHADGRVTPVLYNASVYRDDDEKVAGVFAAARDITQLKRAEAEIKALNTSLEARVAQRTSELVAANKEMEAFAYSVSHDLRAPLRAVDGLCQILYEDYVDALDQQGKELLQRVRAASQHMAQLIEGLLALSRASRGEMQRTSVDVSDLAGVIGRELQNLNPGRDVEFVVSPSLTVNADPNLLRSVLENLLGNAWKFTSKHPHARIEVGAIDHEGKKAYFVRDNGAGFNMAYAGKLFQAFRRLHRSDEFEGTGIGLATVQRIIRRHGGQVWGEGEVEKGATFFFTLPEEQQ